jgi:hypothetical protein
MDPQSLRKVNSTGTSLISPNFPERGQNKFILIITHKMELGAHSKAGIKGPIISFQEM